MNINVLKTYQFWPKKPPLGKHMLEWRSIVDAEQDRSHHDFLEAARKNNLYVLIGVSLDAGNIFDNGSPQMGKAYKDYYLWVCEQLAERYGKHPAVMGFVLGNEMNNPTRLQSSAFWEINAEFVKPFRKHAPNKLLMQAMQNDDNLFLYKINGSSEKLVQKYTQLYDLWAVNVYDGKSFDQFFNRFKPQVAQTDYVRPIIFTEYGVPAGTNDNCTVVELPNNAEIVGQYLKELYKNMTTPEHLEYCCGGTYFEYCDEWWKGNGTSWCTHTTPSQNSAPDFPGGSWEPAWWGLYSVAPKGRTCAAGPWSNAEKKPYPVDTLTKRHAVSVMKDLAIPFGYLGSNKRQKIE
ncbi:hypothetical protein PsW64_03360 [Pseudovibrio sp. W64]|uniref:cellulase family glycosylhydrolase n=1 Tax=Pseudovibrio sp. W64 TaxID=1735583 RepID=UPI0007AE49CA|nr:cellulase family glycosylhydrolase [Pseudovibrio sp. W64]KZK79016.1 hypothetical protein PsW64_03360 [Pseudovibrio sp. W64]